MLNHPTLTQLEELGLSGMAKAFAELLASGDAAGLSLTEGLGLLLDRETSHRRDKRLASRLKYARSETASHGGRCRLPSSPQSRPGHVPEAHRRRLDRRP